ncbi:MAG: DUF177 domain-containing protein [Gammaproteobacteria bacterium]|nr:DUF177 domain-containing protein [Gammaproteobacteria bacterium]
MAFETGLPRDQRAWVSWHDAFELAARRAKFAGALPLAAFDRLGAMLESGDGEVSARLTFSRGEEGVVQVAGECHAALALVCQRCLGGFTQHVDADFSMLLVDGEALIDRLDGDEEMEVVSDRIRPLDLIEDELIMALPLVPVHPDIADCDEPARRVLTPAPEL